MSTTTHSSNRSNRFGSRTLIIFTLAIALFATTAFAPAKAVEGSAGDDLESVRATVTAKYNEKIGLLAEKMAATDNLDKQAIYAAGIAELTGLRDTSVATEDSIDALWALKERAYGIYNETINAAKYAGMTDAEILAAAKNKATNTITYKIDLLNKWTKECKDESLRVIIAGGVAQLNALYPEVEAADTPDAAYAVKDRAYAIYRETVKQAEEAKAEGDCDGLTDEEKAAKELKNARWSTLSLIERKTAILAATAEAAVNPTVSEIYASAAEEVAGLEGAARSAKSIKALKEINETVMDIYRAARDAVADLRGDGDADDDDKDPARTLEAHLGKVAANVEYLTEIASATADDNADTYAAVVAAKDDVLEAIADVLEVAESGKKLDGRWNDLSYALKNFKRAFFAHYFALADGPSRFGKLHIPG
ncbi:MAG: hypothetical protein ACC683_05485 [Acidimicrobiia bacterium]